MKKPILLVLIATMSGCAGMASSMQQARATPERWGGFVLRNGLQVPVVVELARASPDWTGRLRVGNSSMPLQNVRFTPLGIHFELPGEGTFDGTVAGDWMAGSVSGSSALGAFALTREPEPMFADPITSSGP
jgi:hypothetical protein